MLEKSAVAFTSLTGCQTVDRGLRIETANSEIAHVPYVLRPGLPNGRSACVKPLKPSPVTPFNSGFVSAKTGPPLFRYPTVKTNLSGSCVG